MQDLLCCSSGLQALTTSNQLKSKRREDSRKGYHLYLNFQMLGTACLQEAKMLSLKGVCKGLDDLKDELTCKPANPLPAVSGTSTPAATDVAMEEVSDTEGSELSVQLDPRKTQSEPPLSPRSIVGATPEDAEPSLPAEGTGEPEGPPNAGTSLPGGGTGEPEGTPNAGTSLPAGGTGEPEGTRQRWGCQEYRHARFHHSSSLACKGRGAFCTLPILS